MIPYMPGGKDIRLYDENGVLTYEAVYQLYHQGLTPIRVVGTDFTILSHNPAMNALCGVMDPQIIGKKCFEIARSDTACGTDECPVRMILNGAKEVVHHYECILWNGKAFPATCRATPFYDSHGDIIGVIQAITDQSDLMAFSKTLEEKNQELEKRLREIETGLKITEIINSEKKLERMMDKVIQTLSRFIPLSVAIFYVFDKETMELSPALSVGISDTPPSFRLGEGILGEAVKRKEPVFIDDIPPEYLRIRSGALEPIRHSFACIPLFTSQEIVGAIEMASIEGLKSYERFLENISVQLAMGIQNILFLERLEGLQKELIEKNEALQAQNEELQAQSEELLAQTEEIQAQAEELAAQRDALEQKTLEAQEANRMKSVFLSNMSHELRTPLNSIMGLVRLLKDDTSEPLSAKQKEFLDVVLRNSQNLLDLINDILDLTRIESGKEEIRYDMIYLPEYLDGIIKNLEPLAGEKSLDFRVDIENAPKTIFSDPKKIRQILTNLIGNAIKFTESGHVGLTVQKEEGEDRDFVAFYVEDTGIGIPEDALQYIFEPFRQVDGSYTRKYGGTGLGLSISKKLTNMLGGEISVESTVGKGSRFKVTIPTDRRSKYRMPEDEWAKKMRQVLLVSDQGEKTENQDDEGKTIAQKTSPVLVVDDDVIVGREVGTMLKQEGFPVTYCPDPQLGLKLIREKRPSLILLDLKMPIMDGFAFLREMQRAPDISDIPVIILSSRDLDPDTQKGLPKNVKGSLVKGNIKQEELKKTIQAVLSPIGIIKKVEESQEARSTSNSVGTIGTECQKKVLIAEDNPDNLYLIKAILEPRGFEVIHAKNGKEAVELALKCSPDIILMDIQMPEMDGMQATKKIKGMGLRQVPIIALTAKAMKGDKELILGAGLDDYLAKPFHHNELLHMIEKWTQ